MVTESTTKPSASAVLVFIVAVVAVYLLIVFGQTIAWLLEQSALETASLANLADAGRAWFLIQGVLVAGICAVGARFSKSTFQRVYQTWLIAGLITLPAFGLRLLCP